MKRMRFRVSLLIIWLFFLYNIERVDDTIDITRIAYLFVPLVAVLTVSVPFLCKAPWWVQLTFPGALFLLLKVVVRSELWGSAFPLTVMELSIVTLTAALARFVSDGVGEFERAIARIMIGPGDELFEPSSTGEAEMYKELKRARNYGRPLALLALEVDNASIRAALDRMVQEAQQAMMKRYVLSDVAKVLCDKLEDYDIIARRGDHFLVLLPEVPNEQLFELSNRLQEVVYQETGVILKIGTAAFPHDAVTFSNLLEKALKGLKDVEILVDLEDLEKPVHRQPVTTEQQPM